MGKRLSDLPTQSAQVTDYVVGLRASGIKMTVQTIVDLAGDTLANPTVTGTLTLTCPDDSTTHAVVVRKIATEYVLEIVQ
jgi:hypothetical protein